MEENCSIKLFESDLESMLSQVLAKARSRDEKLKAAKETHTDKGVAKAADKKPSVKEKLDRYKAAAKAEKEAERTVPEASKEKPKTPEANRQTVHRQPKKSKKSKER